MIYHLFFLFLLPWLTGAGLFWTFGSSFLTGYSFFSVSTGYYFFTTSTFFSTTGSSTYFGFLDLFLFFPDFGSYFGGGVTGEDVS